MTKPFLTHRMSSPFARCAPEARTSIERAAACRFSTIDGGSQSPGENHATFRPLDCLLADISHATVEISPQNVVRRRALMRHGITAESIDCTGAKRVTFRFRAPLHLLVAYEQGERTAGETFVEGLSPSTLRGFARRLTFAPAGHEYRECHESRTHSRLTFFYFDPAPLPGALASRGGDTQLAPRLLFENSTLWHAAIKLNSLLKHVSSADRGYVQALGTVLLHELVRSNREQPAARHLRGGLASWQQRIVSAYIEDHLAERIPLATLAQLVRLSPYHFCRAFKHSFGVPPHRYHSDQRIEYAKRMLADSDLSVTEVSFQVGFGSSTSFAAAFRRATGLSPTTYLRSL